MIDITNCNKIIVDTIGKTEKIIEWYQQNKDWLDAEEFRIPIPSALVELPEEDIKFYYEQEGVFVRLFQVGKMCMMGGKCVLKN